MFNNFLSLKPILQTCTRFIQHRAQSQLQHQAIRLLEDIENCRESEFFSRRNAESLSIEGAYGLQDEIRSLRETRGEHVVGYKIGCTSPSVRAKFGLNESVAGYLWNSEQYECGRQFQKSEFRNLAIEGELAISLVSTEGSPEDWIVEYEPIIELHHFEFDGSSSQRAAELISKNCIHAGVVHCKSRKRCSLAAVPLDEPIRVILNEIEIERPVLRMLELDGLLGPLATVSWLQKHLSRRNRSLQNGDLILTATPGNLIEVRSDIQHDTECLSVDFEDLKVTASVQNC